ncbi:MAG TPA: 50S ribosomal protein L10 [Acidimicrobiales bacterium]
MENPRPEKVAVVEEVRERFERSSAALLTEYRGLDVAALGELRRSLRDAGGEYKVYKNTMVRFAAREAGIDIEDLLVGPTAIAFVVDRPDGAPADAVLVAKALRDFARGHPALVVKGGIMDDRTLSAADARALADVEPREVLMSRLAGAFAAPMQQFAGLLEALPRNLAYGLKALIDKGGAPGAPQAPAEAEAAPAEAGPAAETGPAAEAGTAEAEPAAEAEAETESAAGEPAAETETDTPAADAGDTTEES